MPHTIEGDYKTKRNRIKYTYAATWDHSKLGIQWRAKIWRGIHPLGSREGLIADTVELDIDRLVTRVIKEEIELIAAAADQQ